MSFFRKGILVSAGQMIGILMGVLSGILYARMLGPDGVGQYRLFSTTSVMVTAISTLGIGSASIYFLNNRKVPLNLIATNCLRFALVTGMLVTILMVIAFLSLPGYFGRISIPVAIIFAMGLGAAPLWSVLYQILVAQLAARRMVSLQLLRAAVVLVGGALLALPCWLTPQTAILVLAASTFCGVGLAVAYRWKNLDLSIRFDWGLFWKVLAYGLKLASANILLLVYLELSVMLLRYLKPDDFVPVGLYSRATAICGLIVIIPRIMGPLLFAKWSGVTGETRIHQVQMALRMGLTYSILTAGFVLVFGKYIIWIMYGRDFLPALDALRILAVSTIFVSIFSVCYNALAGDGRATLVTGVLAVAIVILFSVTCWLVPVFGICGAAVGTLCASGFMATAVVVLCMKLYGLNPLKCLFVHAGDLRYARVAMRRKGPTPPVNSGKDNT